MKEFYIFLLILFFPIAVFAAPSISFDSEKYDFGTVSELSLNHTFILTNKGDEDLIIEGLTPS